MTERHAGTGGSVPPLTRADVERLLSQLESSARLDVSFHNLQQIDLSYMDLEGANLRGADLQGANLSTAQLHGPELRGATLYRTELFARRVKQTHRGMVPRKRLASAKRMLIQERSSPMQGHGVKQGKKMLSDREAYLL